MPTIQTFEDIEAWKKARILGREIHAISIRGEMRRDFALRDQVNRSIGSVMDNIAEGFERNGNKEFLQFLYIAKGSSGELRSQLYRTLDKGYINVEEFTALHAKIMELSQMIAGLIRYLQQSGFKGPKYNN